MWFVRKLNHGIFIFVNQIWKDDVLVKSEKLQNGAIYAAKLNDKWLYAGGWDKVVNIQVCLVALFIWTIKHKHAFSKT